MGNWLPTLGFCRVGRGILGSSLLELPISEHFTHIYFVRYRTKLSKGV